MIECRRRSRLSAEAFQSLRIAGQVLGQELQCNKAAKLSVFGLVNPPHPAAAQLSHDAVMGYGAANQEIVALLCLRALLLREGKSGCFYGGTLQKTSRLLLCAQQRADFAFQRFVTRACVPQKCVALLRRTLQHRLQQAIDLLPPIRVHPSLPRSVRGRAMPWRCSSRASPLRTIL